jgi:hypothetical protein
MTATKSQRFIRKDDSSELTFVNMFDPTLIGLQHLEYPIRLFGRGEIVLVSLETWRITDGRISD